MISNRIQDIIERGQAMADLFTAGDRLKKRFGEGNVYDFSIGNPNVPAPESVKDTVIDVITNVPPTELHSYTKPEGYSEVRKIIAEHDREKYDVDLSEKNIFMTAGSAMGLSALMTTFLDEGDEVIVVKPYFTEYASYVRNAGGILVEVPSKEDTFEIDIEAISKNITRSTKIVLVNTPNNPTGVIYSEENLRDLAEALYEKGNDLGIDIILISDEPYRDLAYGGAVVPYIPKFYDNTIVVYSFSKSLSLPGERIGYITIPDSLVDFKRVKEALGAAIRTVVVNAPSLMQRVAAVCINDECDVAYYEGNANMLYEGLTNIGFECVKPNGAFYLWIKSPYEDDHEFVAKAEDHQIVMVPGSAFAGEGYVRISFCVAREMIEMALPHFKALYDDIKANG